MANLLYLRFFFPFPRGVFSSEMADTLRFVRPTATAL